jgi:hypothetical protein
VRLRRSGWKTNDQQNQRPTVASGTGGRTIPFMLARLSRLVAALLLLALPLQGMAAVRMGLCTHEMPCAKVTALHHHEAEGSATSTRDATTKAPGNVAAHACGEKTGGLTGDNCAQCHACCASALPTTARGGMAAAPPHPVFDIPAAFAGFIPEHLDPPPVG